MSKLQDAKQIVLHLHSSLDDGGIAAYEQSLNDCTDSKYFWRGFHPFNEIRGASAVVEGFYRSLAQSLTSLTRRPDVFFAGENQFASGEVWVCSMGHLMGLFDEEWLGIRPTNKLAMLRYCEFNKVADGKVAETAMYFDIPHLMHQADQFPFAPQTGAQLLQPGPQTHDGLLYDGQDPEEGRKTLELINKMVSDLGQWQSDLPLEEELALTWHDDMLWWGPSGIGATYTIERYAKQHSGIFRKSFSNRSKTKHICRMSEGLYGGFFGWPNFTATLEGGFMGLPKSDVPAEFRVIDIYRRNGEKLAENWIFIDLLHMLNQMGVDVLRRNQSDAR